MFWGGKPVRSGFARVTAAVGGVAVTGCGRVLDVGDVVAAEEGGVWMVPESAILSLLHLERVEDLGFFHEAVRVLLPVASALFGWLS